MIEPSSIYVLYDWSKVVKTKTKIVSSSLCSKLVLTWHSQMHFSIGIRSYSYCLPWSLCDKNDIKILRLRPQRAKPHRSRELVLNATALPGHSDRKICFAEKKVLKLPTTADNLNVGPKFPHFVVCLSSADDFLLLCGCYHDSQKSHRLASLYVEMFHRAKE